MVIVWVYKFTVSQYKIQTVVETQSCFYTLYCNWGVMQTDMIVITIGCTILRNDLSNIYLYLVFMYNNYCGQNNPEWVVIKFDDKTEKSGKQQRSYSLDRSIKQRRR